jgi:hypothetical protein
MIESRQTNRMQKSEWYTCSVCGIDYPRAKVIVHNGKVVCQGDGTAKCKDQPGRDAFYKGPLPTEKPIPPLPHVIEDI